MSRETMPLAYSFKVHNPNQLIDIMTEQGVFLPMDIARHQMANIRFVYLTRRLRNLPFDIIQIDQYWFIDRISQSDLKNVFKQGDRLLIINKTMISDQLKEEDLHKLILHSSIPFIVWVTWDADTYLKYRQASQRIINEDSLISAKAYLLKNSDYEKISLYDQFAFLIADALQQNSLNFRWNAHYPRLRSDLRSAEDPNGFISMMKIHTRLLEGKERDRLKPKDYLITAVPHLMEMAYYFSSAGYGLHTTEMLLVSAAMKRLNDQINSIEMKFWGKILGLYCDYYIVQVRYDGEILPDQIEVINRKRRLTAKKTARNKIDSTVHPEQNITTDIPVEPHGFGVNEYTYFVTTSPGLPWIKLPDVQPTAITHARHIRCLFTGCLSANIEGFSPRFGLEREYLRVQIARITATTHISPAGYFLLAENGDEEEEEPHFNTQGKSPNQQIRRNHEFNNDPTNLITAEFLANTSLQEWVHSLPEILPQGRTQFWRSPSPQTTNFSVEEEDDEEAKSDVENIEIPAPLLQPIGDDKLLHTDQHAWSIGMSMSVMHEYSLCYVRSNVWPGAVTLGHAGNYYNLYVGWGQKYEQFNPSQPPLPEMEYAHQLMEIDDPPVELENSMEENQRALAAEFTSDDDGEEDYEEVLTNEDD